MNRLPGLPLSQDSAITALRNHNVTVGLGVQEQWSARNIRFDVAWVSTTVECVPICSSYL